MANYAYTHGARLIMDGDCDLDTAGDDIRVRMCMTNTTCDTERDKTFLDQFTTLDTMDGANYVDKALANEVVNADEPNDRAEFDGDDLVWTALGAGTRQVAGLVVYKFVTNDAASVPLFWVDSGFPITANGGDVTVTWNAEGIAQLTTT